LYFFVIACHHQQLLLGDRSLDIVFAQAHVDLGCLPQVLQLPIADIVQIALGEAEYVAILAKGAEPVVTRSRCPEIQVTPRATNRGGGEPRAGRLALPADG
jgi:hypothetical protein